ncbi:MAG: monovalent cation/H(+) antiporter subunit G [Methanoregula sp.]|nr:monovalent cation/H(+) antiporter subunit G [Methanoregula sp.]
MSSLLIDLVIWILLIAGVGFGLIGLIGLMLFPDTRSRMYTAIRANLISIGATGIAVIIYGFNALQIPGGNQYFTLLLHTLLLVVVMAIGNYVVSRAILEKTRPIVGNDLLCSG